MTEKSETSASQAPQGTSRIRVGTAPDSWGVWFPDDPAQVPWQRFLDEAGACGYEWIELGPYGYLPTDPARLTDELGARGLKVSAGTVFEHLHRPDSWDAVWDVATRIDSAGWTAEFRVPLSQLRYAPAASHTFGVMIMRDIARYNGKLGLIATGFGEAATAANYAKHHIDPESRVFPGHSSERDGH